MNLGVLSAEFGLAGAVNGAETGARKIKKMFLNEGATDLESVKVQNITCTIEEQLYEFSTELYAKVYETLKSGFKVIIAGGDHSIAIGSIAGASKFAHEKEQKLGVIYVDAHADINIPETSPTGHLHGMPVSFAMGRGGSKLSEIAEYPIKPQDILYIGARSIDKPEKKYIDDNNIQYISSDYINSLNKEVNPVYSIIDEFIAVHNFKQIHLSIDIDVVDPIFAPATGVPELNGISADVFQSIIKYINHTHKVFSIDIVEYNPLLDINNKTEKIIYETCQVIANSNVLPQLSKCQ